VLSDDEPSSRRWRIDYELARIYRTALLQAYELVTRGTERFIEGSFLLSSKLRSYTAMVSRVLGTDLGQRVTADEAMAVEL